MTDAVVVTTTLPSCDEAERLAELAVDRRLAACAQVGPVASVYRWEGAVERADEWRVDFKTTEGAATRLSALLEAEHPYDVPEVVVVRLVGASEPYLAWIRASVDG